jgi:hypothetical protein
MSALADLQGHVRHALLSGDLRLLQPVLAGSPDPARRLAIHQRHYQASLSAALIEKFPATVWLVGSVLMGDAARQFVRKHPPIRPCIAEYGDDFPAFLAGLPAAAHLPYLHDFAELERRFGQTAIDVLLPALSIADVAARGGDWLSDALVALQPGLRYWHASWPVDELFKIFLADSAPETCHIELGSVYLEVRGGRGEVNVMRLSLGEFTFRSGLRNGVRLCEAGDHSARIDPAFDPRQALLALVNDGLVTGIDVPSPVGVQ